MNRLLILILLSISNPLLKQFSKLINLSLLLVWYAHDKFSGSGIHHFPDKDEQKIWLEFKMFDEGTVCI